MIRWATILILLPGLAIAGHELEGRDIDQGRDHYVTHCAACHGINLQGQPNWSVANADGTLPAPPHDETGHTWHHDNRLLFDYTALGGELALKARGISGFKSAMPGFAETLSEDQIWDTLAYIRSTWSPRIQRAQTLRNPPH